MLENVHIKEPEKMLKAYPYELSGGMRQRAMIAIALSCSPKLLIADEPTTALDVTIQAQILGLVKEAADKAGAGVIFISHDLGVIAQVCDSIAVMYSGEIVEAGTAAEVLTTPRHPYTKALLAAIPGFTPKGAERLELCAIPGMVPDPREHMDGCRFAPRCSVCGENCTAKHPPLHVAGDGRSVCCWKEVQAGDAAILLRLENVDKVFVKKTMMGKKSYIHAVRGITLDIQRGEALGIVGESGCGKSTLASLIIRLETLTRGKIILDGTDVTSLKEKDLRPLRRFVQIVFQDPYSSLSPRMTVEEILTEPLKIMTKLSKAEMHAKVKSLLELVGMSESCLDRYPHEFSGGQRQRISIARALTTEPEILILDEPTSALDVSVQAQVLNLLNDLREKLHLTYIFISHNLAVVKYISDRTAVMYAGQIVELGPSEKIMLEPLHPYTQELIAALPAVGKKLKPLTKAADMTENVAQERGCPYQNRCPLVDLRCKSERPPLAQVEPGHFLACWGVTKS
jgi:peptide/nickel transport system ATP-binding protein